MWNLQIWKADYNPISSVSLGSSDYTGGKQVKGVRAMR